METLYMWCAVGAGALFAAQTVMTLVGLGETDLDLDLGDLDLDVDIDPELDTSSEFQPGSATDARFVGWMSIKAIVSGICIFGLTGLAASRSLAPAQTTFIALATGASTMYAVGWLIHSMHKLQADGSARVESSVGKIGSVYLTIPKNNSGLGKVSVEVQGRTMEYEAVTEGDALPTGTQVEIVRVLKGDTVEVWPMEASVM
jgi:hypothetical protein